MATGTAAEAFIQSLGVNTHINFYGGPYGNLSTVNSALNYLGVPNVRDAAGGNDISAWQQVAQATGVHFDDFVGEVNPGQYGSILDTMQQLANLGLLNAVEGVNEPDAAYPVSIGETIGGGASFQQSVWQLGQQLGLPVVNMSFGDINDYGASGDLSAWTDYANAHTYFGTGNNPAWADWIGTLNADAQASASSRPVFITETGYYTTGNGGDPSNVSEAVQAKYTLDLALDAFQSGDARTYFYELLDQNTGDGNNEDNFGLFHSDGSPKLAATGIHNLVTLLNDPGGAGISGGSLDYNLSGLQDTDHTQLLQKSDGTYWLAVWNDTRLSGPFDSSEAYVPPHSVTLTLGSAASNIQVFDPLNGTDAVQGASNTDSLTFDVPDHPILVEIGGTGSAPSSGGGTPDPTPTPTPAPTTTPTPPPAPSPAPSPEPSSHGMTLTAPTTAQDIAGQPAAISGVHITDDYASTNAATVTATVTGDSGTLSTVDAWGNPQQGSSVDLSGTIWQVNAGLANLSYTGDGSGDTVAIRATDSVGNSASQTVALGGTGGSPSSPPPPSDSGPSPTDSGQLISPDDATPVITGSNIAASASAGDHMIFLLGTGDALTATGGTETVEAWQGGNAITTGTGDDTLRFAGSGNTIDAGGGNNHLEDSGSNNTIVLPGAGQGYDDIYGWVTQNGDMFDLRPSLAQAGWNGDSSTLGDFVQVGASGNNAIISINGSAVATLNDAVGTDLSSFLAHAIT